jgi:hypothetical protein
MIKIFMLMIIFLICGCASLQVNLGPPVNNVYVVKPQLIKGKSGAIMKGGSLEDFDLKQEGEATIPVK